MCCHGVVMWQEPVASIVWERMARHWLTYKALGHEKWERILKASKFIVDSSFSWPGNEALTVDLELRGCGGNTVNDELMGGRCFCALAQLQLDTYNNMPIDNEFELD